MVLFVDDESDITDGMRANMRRQPFAVLTANSAQEALSILSSTAVDVVVSDEQMPEMPGSQLLAEVRRRQPEVQRVILTGQASLEATIAAINHAGVFRYLTKPCSPADLITCIEDALAAREAPNPHHVAADARAAVTLDEVLAELHMAYQPICDARTGETVAVEALLRSDHPVLATPMTVLDTAGRLDRLDLVDRTVRGLVAADIARLDPSVSVFVNVSPESLDDPSLAAPDDPLVEHADRVVLEITERAALDDTSAVAARTARLRSLGFRIALDDLGSGYAGLRSFAVLRPDIVKLDRELVRDIHVSDTASRLVRSMVSLCRELDIVSLAEGVETPEEHAHLVALGVDLVQGYLFAKPELLDP